MLQVFFLVHCDFFLVVLAKGYAVIRMASCVGVCMCLSFFL